jgi:rubrerythrin
LLAARIASAAGESGKALELYVAALTCSRTIRIAFEPEARQALSTQAAALTEALHAQPAPDEVEPPEPPRFRCEQCGVASGTWHWRCPSCRNWDSLRSTQNRGN